MTVVALPSFSEQLAVVYDDYLATLGGGERSALAYALALKNLGFTVEILSRNPLPSKARIGEVFGQELAEIAMRRIPASDIFSYLSSAELAVFVNHTFMSFAKNPAKLGIYSQMFPVSAIAARTHPRETAALKTYDLMLCNSTFTKGYTVGLWDYPKERCFVLHPPIGSEHIDAAKSYRAKFPEKKKQFINVGRFNPGTHNKNQKIVIASFLEAKGRPDAIGKSLETWQLHIVGNSNADESSETYLRDCLQMAEASGGSVRIHQNLDIGSLKTLLADSFAYVHATGAFTPPGVDPFKCEHLGLSIIEAMANGCIPLVYARGGIFDIFTPGEMGVPYITQEGLVEGFGEIAGMFGTAAATEIQGKCLVAASEQSQQHFTEKLANFVARGLVR